MGFKSSPSGSFSLRLNGKPTLDFGPALHDQSWRSADAKVQISYLTMEDSPHESNGILTITVADSLLEPGKPITFEIVGMSDVEGVVSATERCRRASYLHLSSGR
jgi:hypothetical protein